MTCSSSGLALQFRQVFGNEVLVLHRKDRQFQADEATDFARPQATRIDDMLGVNRPLLGDHVPGAVSTLPGVDDAVLAHDLGACELRGLGVRVRHAVRIDVAFDRIVDRAEKVLLVEQRIQLLRFRRRYQLQVHAEIAAARHGHAQPVDPLGRAGQHQAAGDVHAARNAGNRFDLLVQLDRVLLQLGDVRIAVDGVHAARRVPGRTGREFRALEQQHVLPARFREVIQHARAHDAATDHRHLHMSPHAKPR